MDLGSWIHINIGGCICVSCSLYQGEWMNCFGGREIWKGVGGKCISTSDCRACLWCHPPPPPHINLLSPLSAAQDVILQMNWTRINWEFNTSCFYPGNPWQGWQNQGSMSLKTKLKLVLSIAGSWLVRLVLLLVSLALLLVLLFFFVKRKLKV